MLLFICTKIILLLFYLFIFFFMKIIIIIFLCSGTGGGGGGGSYFLNEIQTMFSQLAKRSARVLLRVLPADLVLIMHITSKSIDQRS